MTNTLQVQIGADIVAINARDFDNLPFDLHLKDAPGIMTLTGNNLAEQTVGDRINITGMTSYIDDISLSGTTSASSIALQAHDTIPLWGIQSTGPMKLIDLRASDLSDSSQLIAPSTLLLGGGMAATINITQNIPFVNFTGGSYSDSQINLTGGSGISPGSLGASLSLQNLTDTPLTYSGIFKSLRLNSAMESTSGAGFITAGGAGTMSVKSNYDYGLTYTPSLSLNYTLNSFHIGGTASGSWDIGGATGTLAAHTFDSGFNGTFGSISKFSAAGDFSGMLSAGSIGSATIGNNMTGGTFDLTNPYSANSWNLGSLHVGNSIEDSTIMSNGNLGTIGTMFTYYSQIEAGINPAYVFGQPLGSSDYTSYSIIKSFTSDCPSHHKLHYTGSYVGAYDLQSVHLGNVQTDNSGSPFGLAGYRMDALSILLNGKTISLKTLNSAAEFITGLQGYGLTQQSLGDFNVLFPM